ncbi:MULTISPECIES: type VI secretion system baseplate subunit TssK [unclassified Serratia (in: enterobacteria)]|uniref:type VI secretion system baseplate subunit TssK n=1 Tax=unclassified Serratia (in: enterobacteria) TaxID=2647522 RepID=UPI0005040C3A|nr:MULTISPECIES: type VI secretion system baseplate subunit TssK [unclassified Serratia (in: enterobacteria)]KFK97913.1 type VI secretion protein [Serratia sp. Ag2]KFL00304.1 type VI secretion protein [Serratia sp. Ag1]
MKNAHKVVWTEGMFLRPHHFQQAENYLENYVKRWGQSHCGYFWGFLTLELDQTLLRQGKIALNAASGILPDGTPFELSGAQHLLPALDIADNQVGERVVLALPTYRAGREEILFQEASGSLARYLAYETEVNDLNTVAVGSAALQFGQLRLRLMRESELSPEWTALTVCLVQERQNDNSLRLDPALIPPMLNCHGSQILKTFINDLQGLLTQRSQQMSQRLLQSGQRGSSEIADFMLLQLINRYLGQVSHARTLDYLHPERLFAEWLQFATELSSFSATRTSETKLPAYDHNNLTLGFSALMLMLRQGLSVVLEDNAIQLLLTERSHGLNVATVQDTKMMHDFGFVLAVRANVAMEALLSRFPAQMKIASVTRIRDLVQLQLPGIGLRTMPAAPRQIPYHAGYTYFELEKHGDLWKEMEKSSAFALHLAGDFPGLEMEFWAIRNQTER